jgi:hypothetical protein
MLGGAEEVHQLVGGGRVPRRSPARCSAVAVDAPGLRAGAGPVPSVVACGRVGRRDTTGRTESDPLVRLAWPWAQDERGRSAGLQWGVDL